MKPVLKKIYVPLIVMLVIGATELILRCLGYSPGVFRHIEGFSRVDSLVLYKTFVTDEAGIYKFSTWVCDSIPQYYNFAKGEITESRIEHNIYSVDQIDYNYQSYARLLNQNAGNALRWKIQRYFSKEYHPGTFENTVKKLASLSTLDTIDEWRTAILDYVAHPYNREGFRSIAFKQHRTKRKRILVIGDSFVYGMSAAPCYNSFPDILLSDGYLVYAAGIPGTDPAQYAAIAKKYIPLLKPDLVILCFYEGNDLMNFSRWAKQNEPPEYITNAGFFNSNINGKYYTVQQAYDYYLSLETIPNDGTILSCILSKTSISSLVWGLLRKLSVTHHTVENVTNPVKLVDVARQIEFTKIYTDGFRELCNKSSTSFFIVVIPNKYGQKFTKDKFLSIDTGTIEKIFGKDYLYPDSLDLEKHFPKDDYHFNNQGHKLFASFLEKIIRQLDTALAN